jgi:Zn-dependent metalloprotease
MLLCLGLALAAASAAQAQRPDPHVERSDLYQRPLAQASKRNTTLAGRTRTVHQRHAQMLGLDQDTRLVLKERQTSHGVRSHRYRQMFRGLPVYGEDVIVNEAEDGRVKSLFGRLTEGLQDAALPQARIRVNKAQALRIAKSAGLGNRVGFMRTQNEHAELNVFIDDTRRAYRAWIVNYFADTARGGFPTRPFVAIDADSGRVLKQWDGLKHARIGTGPGGNLKTGLYEYGSSLTYGFLDVQTLANNMCRLADARVRTVNLNHSTDWQAWRLPHTYACPRNTVKSINGAHSPMNDAHYFGGVVHDLFVAHYGRAPASTPMTMNVHYGTNYSGAFYNGNAVMFGDGDPTQSPAVQTYPWTVLDVTAHEIAHGFESTNANLQPWAEPGAISEAYADLVGETAEYYLRGQNDWIFGREVMKNHYGLRRLDTPPIDHVLKMTVQGEIEANSGVYSRAFYLLATKPGWDIVKVFKVATRAVDLYWNTGTNFQRGACGLRTAAQDLGYSPTDVDDAFEQVGVFCAVPNMAFTQTSPDGRLEIAVFERYSDTAKSIHSDFLVTIPDDTYTLIGGGVEGAEGPVGHLITMSRPAGKHWVVSTKDHLQADPHRIRAWAIGLRVVGMANYQLAGSMQITSATTSAAVPHPEATALVPFGYHLIGGGFKVNWSGMGNMAFESAPAGITGWRARSKDHVVSSPGTITSFAISIANNVGISNGGNWTFYNFRSSIASETSTVAPHPSTTVFVPGGHVLSGCGGTVHWQGTGSLLWQIKPTNIYRGVIGCMVGGKEHLGSDPSSATAYAIGLRLD